MNPPKKAPKPISFTVLQAELIHELAREQAALANETVKLIAQLREAHAYAMRVKKAVLSRPQNEKAKIIPFPARAVRRQIERVQ